MNNPALTELNPIIAAPAASWWPLAPGWYAIAIIALGALVLLSVSISRAIRRRRVRRAALKALNPHTRVNDITLLLKQACMGYYPRQRIAKLTGADWRDFLVQHLSERQAARYYDLLLDVEQAAYRPASETREIEQRYYKFARHWLKSALPPSKKAAQGATQ